MGDHHSLDCPACGEFISQNLAKYHTCYWCNAELPGYFAVKEEQDIIDIEDAFDAGDFDDFDL